MIQRGNPLRPSRLLVVDDTAAGRITVEAALAREGHEIMMAESGAECLRIAASRAPDLILLDVMMPGMDGFEVCRRIRQDRNLSGIPVVMVTALHDSESMSRGIEAGADDFIGKPFNKWEMRARVASLIRLGAQQRSLAERDRLSWVLEHAADGFVLLDRKGQIVDCNATARRFLGFASDDPAQGDFVSRVTRDNVPHPSRAWERWGTTEGNDTPLLLARNVEGAYHKEWLQVTPHRDTTDPDGMTVVNLRDATAQVERQMRLFEFHELVSHKLRTPLTGIVAAVDLLGFDVDKMPEHAVRMVNVLKVSVRRLNEAVADVLEFVDCGATREPPLAVGSFEALVHAAADEQHIRHVAVDVQSSLASSAVSLGEVSMRAILRELMENSRRFHPKEDPTVTVNVTAEHADWLRIDVADDGITLTPGQLERVLEPYVQGDPALTGEVPGMGLGLALVATRIRSAGGRCVVENRSDHAGVRVRMDLPCRAA